MKSTHVSELLGCGQLKEGCERPRVVDDRQLEDGELLSGAAETLVLVCDIQGVVGASIYLADDKLAVVDDK